MASPDDQVEELVSAAKQWQGGDDEAVNRIKGKQLTRKQWAAWINRIQKTSSEQELREAARAAIATEPY